MKYASVWIALSLAAGIAMGPLCSLSRYWLWAAALGCGVIAFLARKRGRTVCMTAILLAVLALGLLRAASVPTFPEWLLRRAPGIDELTGIVISYPDLGADSISFTLEPRDLPGDVIVYWPTEQPIAQVHIGDTVHVKGSARLPEPFDGFDYPSYLARRGVFASFFADELEVVASAVGATLWHWGDRARQSILARFRDALPAPVAAMAQSLMFGDRSALDEATEEAFSRTGLMHLLAVSGLHLGIFLAAAWWGLRRIGLRPRLTYPIVGLLVLLALIVVGPRVSLVRAGLLFAFLALGSVLADCGLILRRWIHPINGLAMAAIVILVLRPGALYEAGFQLTMAATASILIAFSPLGWGTRLTSHAITGRFGKVKGWPLRLLVVSAAAQAGAAPVIAWHFQTFQPFSIFVNLIAVPLAGISLWAGLLALPWMATSVFAYAVLPLSALLEAMEGMVRWLARFRWVSLSVIPSVGIWMAGCIGFLILTDYVGVSSSRTSNSISMASDRDGGWRSGPP